jgi:predicted ribosome quality control (RQC) complex YloA/Tae2 family protein
MPQQLALSSLPLVYFEQDKNLTMMLILLLSFIKNCNKSLSILVIILLFVYSSLHSLLLNLFIEMLYIFFVYLSFKKTKPNEITEQENFQSKSPFLFADTEGNILRLNNEALKFFQRTETEMKTLKISQLLKQEKKKLKRGLKNIFFTLKFLSK